MLEKLEIVLISVRWKIVLNDIPTKQTRIKRFFLNNIGTWHPVFNFQPADSKSKPALRNHGDVGLSGNFAKTNLWASSPSRIWFSNCASSTDLRISLKSGPGT